MFSKEQIEKDLRKEFRLSDTDEIFYEPISKTEMEVKDYADFLYNKQLKPKRKKQFFQGGWTYADLILYAKWDNWSKNCNDIDINLPPKDLKLALFEHGNLGDTALIKLYDSKDRFIYLSIDSNIEVLCVIDKNIFDNSQSLEI